MKIHFLFYLSLLFIACSPPSLETKGGIDLTLKSSSINDQVIVLSSISSRLAKIVPYPDAINATSAENEMNFSLVDYQDTTTVRQLCKWSRGMKLVYALPKSVQEQVRMYLAERISFSDLEKPFKASSMIGLVDASDRDTIIKVINSDEFEATFPTAGQHYWGNKLVDQKFALFMEDKNSPVIEENMFESVEPFADKDGKEGILGLKLLPDYSDRIGKLTGNDSTYLLHILHEEVYISKIIEPHITDPSFSMSGAFTPQDALVISTIWNSPELPVTPSIKAMTVVVPK